MAKVSWETISIRLKLCKNAELMYYDKEKKRYFFVCTAESTLWNGIPEWLNHQVGRW